MGNVDAHPASEGRGIAQRMVESVLCGTHFDGG